MRRIVGVIIVLLCLGVLVHDAGMGRLSVFRRVYGASDLAASLMVAVVRGDARQVDLALRRGADPAMRERPSVDLFPYLDPAMPLQTRADHMRARHAVESGSSPLTLAVTEGRPDIMTLLMQYGAKPDWGHPWWASAFDGAAMSGRTEVVAILVYSGADVNTRPPFRHTPLEAAARHGHWRVCDVLMCGGADVNTRDGLGQTPLHMAVMNGHLAVCDVLTQWDADMSLRDICGFTPLHRAAFDGHPEICELLIRRGADVNARNSDCGTPLDVAYSPHGKDRQEQVVALLRKHGGKWADQLDAEAGR